MYLVKRAPFLVGCIQVRQEEGVRLKKGRAKRRAEPPLWGGGLLLLRKKPSFLAMLT